MSNDGGNPLKGNTIKSKRDEHIYADSPLIQGLLECAPQLETERYQIGRTSIVENVKRGDFAICDKQEQRRYFVIRKDIRLLTYDGIDRCFLIPSPYPIQAMQVDEELKGFLVKVAEKLKLELKTEEMATHRVYKSPMGVNCVFRKRTEDRFLPSLLQEDVDKIDARSEWYQKNSQKYMPEWKAHCWAWDEAMGMRIKTEDGALLFDHLTDRVGFMMDNGRPVWTTRTVKYDSVIRDFEKYRTDTRVLQEEDFWKSPKEHGYYYY